MANIRVIYAEISFVIKEKNKRRELQKIKMASYLHRTAQPFTLATFRSWGSSTGAGRIRLAAAKIMNTHDESTMIGNATKGEIYFTKSQTVFLPS